MALHLLVFALAGLTVVLVAWFMAPGSEHVNFLASTAFGVVGALLGGLIAWHYWPTTDGQFHSVAILAALLGAGGLFWAYRAYARFGEAEE